MQKELTLRDIVSTLSRSVREYKRMSALTPVLVILEVVIECIIPFITAQLITDMHMELAKSFDEALQKAYGYEGRDARVAVVPDDLAVIVG
jgi:nickel-dependent lactate racemase